MKKSDWLNATRRTPLALLSLCLLPLCLLLTRPATAQESSNEPWYQVEVVLFAYKRPSESELWRKDINLSYPINWMALSAAGAAATPEQAAKSFVQLPREQLQLNSEAGHLARSRDMRVLLHTGWRQPVGARENAPGVLIAAGEKFGEHSELEGTISVGLSRYLHVSTNLWLTRFANNLGQNKDAEAWPPLPLRPDAAAEKYARLYAEDAGSLWDKDPAASQLLNLTEADDQPFVPALVALMQQSRRMRSKELHYIDHPLMGMLILIEPVDATAE